MRATRRRRQRWLAVWFYRSGAVATAATALVALLAVLATSVLVATSPVPASNAAQFAPGLPSAPAIASVTPGDQQLTVAFNPPATAGGVVTYQYSTDGGVTWRMRADGGSTASPLVVTVDSATGLPLVNGTSYVIRLRAVNAVGSGFVSNAVAGTPVGSAAVPGAPTSVVAWPTFAAAVVNWAPPQYDGGSTVTSYVATASPGGATCGVSAPDTWCTISDLSNSSTYTVTVRAINVAGSSPPSQPSNPVTPAPLPGQPTNVVGVAGDGAVAVSWIPSDENRGPPVRRFTATADPGGAQCTVNAPATTCTVTGLVNQTAYRFSVVATNNTGDGPPSQPSAPVVPVASMAAVATASSADPFGVAIGATDRDGPAVPGVDGGPVSGSGRPGIGSGTPQWDVTPGLVSFGPVISPGASGGPTDPESGGSPDGGPDVQADWGVVGPPPPHRSVATVDVDVVVTATQGLAAWCWATQGTAGHSVALFVSQGTGEVVVPVGWRPLSGPAAGLGSLGAGTVARFVISVPASLEVGRHRVWGTCIDPLGVEVGPGLAGTLDVVMVPAGGR